MQKPSTENVVIQQRAPLCMVEYYARAKDVLIAYGAQLPDASEEAKKRLREVEFHLDEVSNYVLEGGVFYEC